MAIEDPRRILGDGVTDYQHPYQVAEAADALLLVTEWNASKQPNMEPVKLLMCQPVLLHRWNIHDPQPLRDLGFIYWGIGRGYSAGSKNAG